MRGIEAASVGMEWEETETYGIYRRDKTFVIFVTFDLAQS